MNLHVCVCVCACMCVYGFLDGTQAAYVDLHGRLQTLIQICIVVEQRHTVKHFIFAASYFRDFGT